MKTLFAVSLVAAALASGPAHSDESRAAGQPVYDTEVFFESDRAELAEHGRKVLDDLARRLLQAELVGVIASAHADWPGSAHYNAMLSARRAEAIRAYLVEQGVPESVVQIHAGR